VEQNYPQSVSLLEILQSQKYPSLQNQVVDLLVLIQETVLIQHFVAVQHFVVQTTKDWVSEEFL